MSEPFRFTFTFTLPRELCREAPTFTFTFTLPPELRLAAPAGHHQPGIAGCELTVDSRGQVAVEGNSPDHAQESPRLREHLLARGYGPLETAATLRVNALAPEQVIYEPGGGDSWSIVIGADVVIAAAASIARQDARKRAGVEHSASRHKGGDSIAREDIRAETPVFAG